ncbi:MAG: tryptophan synthase subunit alpha [Thermodesulfobacteriota bacterium]
MSKIDKVFRTLAKKRQTALIPFLVGGDPDLETSAALVWKMAEWGADLIEIGVPYSDPIADGPTIQRAAQKALSQGVNLAKILKWAEELQGVPIPLVLMSYFNPIFCYGLRKFAHDCRRLGISGVIIPDLPPEEARAWVREARAAKVDTIFLTSPTSPEERIKKIVRLSRGFIYHVSLTGTTGAREQLAPNIWPVIEKIRKESQKPVAVGFGISTPAHAKEIKAIADGVIMGSALIKIIEEAKNKAELFGRMENFLQPFISILHSPL